MPYQGPAARVYILVLNWNGWPDTLLCLESLLRGQGLDQRIVVWDNGSTDGSVERIADWAYGRLDACLDVPVPLHACIRPAITKPLDFEAIAAGDPGRGALLTVVAGGANLGYAGGNNAALRWALDQDDCSHVWILNNDTLVASDTGAQMLNAALEDPFDRPIGAHIYHLDSPGKLQACGGQRLGHGPFVAPRYVDHVEAVDYLTGVSLFLSRTCVRALGYFNEDYFLNAEDLEFTYAYKREFVRRHRDVPAFVVAGRLWHRESSTQSRNRYLHTYYFTRNVLYAARRIGLAHAMATLTHAYARIVLARLRGQPTAARGIARGIADYRAGIVGMHQEKAR